MHVKSSLAVATLAGIALSASVCAQTYPAKVVRVVAAFPAGTGVDISARIVAAKLSETLGQQFVVDNRAGAGGNIAAEIVAKAPPDGYTLLFTNNAHTINPNLYRSIPYHSVKDFEPVSLAGSSAMIMVAHPSLPVNSVKELIALAKARPGQINIASAGSGSPSHLGGALFKHLANIDVVHVPYKGAPAALTDLIAGQVDLYVSGLPPALAMMHIPATQYVDALRARARLLREFVANVFDRVDVLHLPAVGIETPTLEDTADEGSARQPQILESVTRFTRWVNYLGLPALALPCGFTEKRMPVGFQLIGRPFSERALFRVGHAYQQATRWHAAAPAA